MMFVEVGAGCYEVLSVCVCVFFFFWPETGYLAGQFLY